MTLFTQKIVCLYTQLALASWQALRKSSSPQDFLLKWKCANTEMKTTNKRERFFKNQGGNEKLKNLHRKKNYDSALSWWSFIRRVFLLAHSKCFIWVRYKYISLLTIINGYHETAITASLFSSSEHFSTESDKFSFLLHLYRTVHYTHILPLCKKRRFQ